MAPWVLRAIALVRGPVGPYVTAAIFALMALPVVLFDVEVYAKQFTSYQDDPLPPTDPSVITAGLLAVLLAAVVGSIAAVPFARRRVLTGWMTRSPGGMGDRRRHAPTRTDDRGSAVRHRIGSASPVAGRSSSRQASGSSLGNWSGGRAGS